MVKTLKKWISPAVIALLAITAFDAKGVEVTWVGGGAINTTNWENGQNWTGSNVPTVSDVAVFVGSPAYQPSVNSKSVFIQKVLFQSAGWTIGSTAPSNSITTQAGGIHSATTGTNTINSAVNMGGVTSQTWTVDSGGTLVMGGNIFNGTTLTKTGGGTLNLATTGTFSSTTLIVSEGTLLLNGRITGANGVEVQSGAKLEGSGTVTKISGAGTVGPGNSPGILTAGSVDGSLGTDFTFEFTRAAVSGTSTPIFSNAAASGNDVLRLTGGTPFTTALGAGNVVTLDFTGVTLTLGDVYQGGFYADTSNFLSSISSATFNYVGVGEEFKMVLSTRQVLGDFAGGDKNGYITQFTVVPEPATTALLALSLGGLWFAARRRKGQKVSG